MPVLPFAGSLTSLWLISGGLLLQPHHEYAWMLDYFVAGNPTTVVGVDTRREDADGAAFSFLTRAITLPERVKIISRATTGSCNRTATLSSRLTFTPAAVP